MTNEEAKGRLESFIDTFNICKEHDNALVAVSISKEDIQAFTQAIKALEQQPCEDWYDVPSYEMTLEQARQAVKDLRKKLAEYLNQEPCDDCISRQAVLDGVDRYIYKSQSTGTQDDFYSFAELVVKELPSVTPQEKTGKWILTDVEGNRVWHCNCSECNKDPQDYIGGSENWWVLKNKLPKYCPNCGCQMINRKE